MSFSTENTWFSFNTDFKVDKPESKEYFKGEGAGLNKCWRHYCFNNIVLINYVTIPWMYKGNGNQDRGNLQKKEEF